MFSKSPDGESYRAQHYRFVPQAEQEWETLYLDLDNNLIENAERLISQLKQGIRYQSPRLVYRHLIIGTEDNPIKMKMPTMEIEP